jgi:hypothetical protein
MVFEKMGGEVAYFGKPHAEVYNLSIAGMIIPPAVFSLLSNTSINTLSCNGLNFIKSPFNSI